jgi:hypothetical protein
MSSDYEYPRVTRTDRLLRVEIRPSPSEARYLEIPAVLDLDRYGDVIGIEFISVRFHAGMNLFDNLDLGARDGGTGLWLKYDKGVDCLYVSLESDRSFDQRPEDVRMLVDGPGRLNRHRGSAGPGLILEK